MNCGLQTEFVAFGAQPEKAASGDIAEIAVVSKFLAREYIAQVNFNKRDPDCEQGIANRNAGVGKSTRIQQDEIDLAR